MGSSYHSLYFHLVFHTKHSQDFIAVEWRERLHAYLGGLVRQQNGIPIAVGGVADHVHLLVRLHPVHSIADLMRDVKRGSSRWVHQEIGLKSFGWQDGYRAFSVSSSKMEIVRRYVLNQEAHHHRISSQEEYVKLVRINAAGSDGILPGPPPSAP